VNRLLEINDRHPLLTTAVGTISGLAPWLLENAENITLIAKMIGSVASAALAVFAVTLKLYGWWQHRRLDPPIDRYDDLP